jgi:dienelactone hydrolase
MRLLVLLLATAFGAQAQSRYRDLAAILARPLETPEMVSFQVHQYLYQRMAKLPSPKSAAEWTAETGRLQKHLLDDVIFHGWPQAWVDAAPRFEEAGIIETGHGYRIRKLRYEVVPGMQSTALLYEPEHATGKLPAVLNVNGHELGVGKAAEYKQKRCINLALHGIYALSPEWLGCGELSGEESRHQFGGHIDITGVNEVGLFYLVMRRGLDYLDSLPAVDRTRLAVTGLSGGGWQTIVLSALDPRVRVAIPVAGYSAIISKLEHDDDLGDNEQASADFLKDFDYSTLTAMRAPRPTLLIHNAEDDCCFRAPLVKPYTYDQVRPFFRLFGKEDLFQWHENSDPSTHNYQLDNRLHAYRFLSRQFGMSPIEEEIPTDGQVRSVEELAVGLPKDNLTILGFARKLAVGIEREPIPADAPARLKWAAAQRARLASTVRYQPVAVEHAWALANTKSRGIEKFSYQMLFRGQLSATAVRVRAITAPENAQAVIVLSDAGKKSAADRVADHVNNGEQVLALDLAFHADASPPTREFELFPLLISSMGQRALGLEAAQLIAAARWMRELSGGKPIAVNSTGKRYQVIALIAAAIEPDLFRGVTVQDGMRSLQSLLDKPVRFQDAPDLFCLDLYKQFDIDRLAAMAGESRVRQSFE